MQEKIRTAEDRLNRAIEVWEAQKRTKTKTPKIAAVWGLYSGGYDSYLACKIASSHPYFKGVIHVNTQTSPAAHLVTVYARELAQAEGWRFVEVSPFIKARMLNIEYGFPSPNAHEFYYQYLKGRPLSAVRDAVKGLLLDELMGEKTIDISAQLELDQEGNFTWLSDKKWTKQRSALAAVNHVAYVSGKRRDESKKRSTTAEWEIANGVLWVNNVVDWHITERDEFIRATIKKRNDLADQTGMSGECECGAHAKRGEIDLKCQIVKRMAEYRAKTEALVRAARELQLLEVELGMRSPDRVIDEHDTVWGHGRRTVTTTNIPSAMQMDMFRICDTCEGEFAADGDVGADPDLEMTAAIFLRDNRMKAGESA